jgi:uncharacterized protein (DUF1778 family)
MKAKNFTKKPMALSSFRLPAKDAELLRLAATREDISQSEFLRKAIRERSRRVLLSEEVASDR